MKRVLLCQDIDPAGRRVLEGKTQVVVAPAPREQTIRGIIADFQGVIIRSATTLSRETLDAATKLEVIGRAGAGVNNIDVVAATERAIPVCYAPVANSSSVVEHTLALILALAKQLPLMDQAVRQGHFEIRYENRPVDVAGKTLGVVGLGRIGREVARKSALMLQMNVVGYDPYLGLDNNATGIEFASELAALFEQADFVTVHVPLTTQTHHMVNAELIGRMRPSSYLINTSRGAVVDEVALTQALAQGNIAGAGLDVFEEEPLPADNPLFGLDNVILTPHTAALTRECVARVAVDAAQGVMDVLEGRRPQYVFNPEVFG